MKKIFVCGDSFNVDDPEWPNIHWTAKLQPKYSITNLSSPGASNLLIHAQIDYAISQSPDLIIVSFTSSLRATIKYQNNLSVKNNILDRFNSPDSDLICFPYAGAELYNALSDHQISILKQYTTEFVDLDLLRLENYYIIKDALETLVQSNIKFSYSLGGFDHKTFIDHSEYKFNKFNKFRSPINLWDHCDIKKTIRPWYHVLDNNVHSELAEYVKCLIKS